MKKTFAAFLTAVLTFTLAGCSLIPSSDPNPTPTGPVELTLADVVTGTDEKIASDGVLVTYNSPEGDARISGFNAASDLYINSFQFTVTQNGTEEYQQISAEATDPTWNNIRELLTAKNGDLLLFAVPEPTLGGAYIQDIYDAGSAPTFKRTITWAGKTSAQTVLTVTAADGAIVDVEVTNNFTPNKDAFIPEVCIMTARLDGCLKTAEFTYGGGKPKTYFTRALEAYEKQLPDKASITTFEDLNRAMRDTVLNASSTGYVTTNRTATIPAIWNYDWSTKTGTGLVEVGINQIASIATSVYDVDARVFQSAFLDRTDGGAMYTGGTLHYDQSSTSYILDGMDDTQGALTFTFTDGLLSSITDARYNRKNPDRWTIEFRNPPAPTS